MVKSIILSLIVSLASIGGFSQKNDNVSNLSDKINRTFRSEPQGGQTAIPAGCLDVKVNQNSVTEQTQYYNFNFSVAKHIYSSSRYSSCELVITDSNFSEDFSSSAVPEYESELYSIKQVSSNGTVIIPNTAKYSSYFTFKITSISANCIQASLKSRKINKIIIPENVTNIDVDAFKGINNEAQFYCVAPEAKPGFETGWNQGLTVNYSYSYANRTEENEAIGPSYTTYRDVNNGHQYVLGTYDENNASNYSPLALQYDVILANQSRETRTDEFPLDSAHSTFNGIGTLAENKLDAVNANLNLPKPEITGAIAGSNVINLSIVLELGEGEKVDDDSLKILNIHEFSGDTANPIAGKTTLFYKDGISTSDKYSVEQFLKISPLRISNYLNYTQIEVNVDEVEGIFQIVNPVVYQNNKDKIASGEMVIRYRLTSIYDTRFVFTYKNTSGDIVSKKVYIQAPDGYNFINFNKALNNRTGFLVRNDQVGDDFDGRNILKVEMESFHISLDIFSNKTHSPISTANTSLKFGRTTLFDSSKDQITINNLDVLAIVVIISAFFIFIAAAVVLFFVYKNIFKNDEFRRLKPKQFIKKGFIYLLGYMLIVLSILSIVIRWGFLESAIIVFNPIDALVIIFTISGAIALGLFIRNFVVSMKQARQRKVANKLKLNELKAEDGTN